MALPPPPPPIEVMEENAELPPTDPRTEFEVAPDPPAPTVTVIAPELIANAVAVRKPPAPPPPPLELPPPPPPAMTK